MAENEIVSEVLYDSLFRYIKKLKVYFIKYAYMALTIHKM